MEKLTANVYAETGARGCNTSFVVTSEGVVAIDTPITLAIARKWLAEIAKHGALRYVINGEAHPDHIAGNCYMGGILIAHEGSREAILKTDLNALKQMQQRMAPGSPSPDDDSLKLRPPDITLSERLTLYLGKHTFKLMALPGHSPYQVSVYVPEEKVIFTSDNVVTQGTPFFHQALPDEWIKSLQYIDKLDFDKIVPGHGEVKDKSYIQQMIKIIHTWTDPVIGMVKKGLTLEETQKQMTAIKEFADIAKNSSIAGVVAMNVAGIYAYYKNKK
jgi:cyclase